MRRYRLRYRNHDLEVPQGEFVVGRSEECNLALDDPLVSRRHAIFRLEGEKFRVEDLGSRNGVVVNGNRVSGSLALKDGDVITIGGEDLTVQSAEEVSPTERRRAAVTMTGEMSSPGMNALSLLTGVVDKALALGKVEDAERILQNLLADTLTALQAGRGDVKTLDESTRFALRLAVEAGKVSWIDWIFLAHHAGGKVVPATTIDELHNVVRRLKYTVTPALRTYLEGLRARVDKLTPTERFALKRTEGLVQVILA